MFITTNDTSRRHFDPDTRDLVQVRVVHGSWKREDSNGIHIEVIRPSFPNAPLDGKPTDYRTHRSGTQTSK